MFIEINQLICLIKDICIVTFQACRSFYNFKLQRIQVSEKTTDRVGCSSQWGRNLRTNLWMGKEEEIVLDAEIDLLHIINVPENNKFGKTVK